MYIEIKNNNTNTITIIIMVRSACIDKNGLKKGAWSKEEDDRLRAYILKYGHWNWRLLPKYAGLARCGKSCRLRWVNYLKPGLKRGNYTKQEEQLIIKLHHEFGNKWSAIATKLPGRTDNEIKNHWHAHLKKSVETRISAKIETFRQDDDEEQMNISLADRNRNDDTSFNEDQILLPKMIKICDQVSGDDNVVEYYSSNSLINPNPDIWDYSNHNAVPEFNVFSSSAETSNSQMDYFGDQNLSETLSSGLIKDDNPISSDSFDGFQSRFWNEPFLVDPYFYAQSDCFSGYLSDFDATVDLFVEGLGACLFLEGPAPGLLLKGLTIAGCLKEVLLLAGMLLQGGVAAVWLPVAFLGTLVAFAQLLSYNNNTET